MLRRIEIPSSLHIMRVCGSSSSFNLYPLEIFDYRKKIENIGVLKVFNGLGER